MVEQTREHNCNLVFNRKKIVKLTITDHYELKHKMTVNDFLIRKILEAKLNGEELDPIEWIGMKERDIFRFDAIYENRKYRLIFWFKNDESNHLWIRNCYPIDFC